jgi:hypothetical protein
VCACQLGVSANLVDHHGELLTQIGALVELQWVLPGAKMSTNLVKPALTCNL